MIIFYSCLLLILIGLWIGAKLAGPILPVTDISYSKPFLAPAVLICKGMDRIRIHISGGGGSERRNIKNRRLAANLKTLYPGENEYSQYCRYRAEKISAMLLILMTGAAAGLTAKITAIGQGVLKDGNVIYRSEYGGADVTADLTVGIQNNDSEPEEEQPLTVTVPARIYTYEEADELFNDMDKELDSLLLAENTGAEHVTGPLDLVKNVEGYPFSISWECSDYEYLDTDGEVRNDSLEEPVLVTVTGDCIYEHYHWYIVRTFRICPREMTESERVQKEISEAVDERNEASASEDRLTLPDRISAGNISWSENAADGSRYIILIALAVCLLIGPAREADVNKKIRLRSRELLAEYPAFISKLTLYMSAGMSVRNCFLKLGSDSEKSPASRRSFLGKELAITANELRMGISETEAYEHFGRRCGSREYMRFTALLTQNLRKGSTDLIRLLKEEAEDAFLLRKNEARKLGEEASTKLLLPMVMMLAVVMVIIMVPAYMSFSS